MSFVGNYYALAIKDPVSSNMDKHGGTLAAFKQQFIQM
jgi:hypothetical protein